MPDLNIILKKRKKSWIKMLLRLYEINSTELNYLKLGYHNYVGCWRQKCLENKKINSV